MNEALVRSAQNGDQGAFAKLVEEYYRPIYGVAFSTVGNWQAAEDVAQDAFLLAWMNIGKLRTLEAFGAWMRRIARNLSCNWIRSDRYRRALLERREALASEPDSNRCAAVDNLARTDARAEIWTALSTLSPALREAVVLFYLEENSITETAAVLGITENSVKKRLQHARPQLRRHFEEQWKAEMEGERRRIHSSEAGQRFLAGAVLGPVFGLTGKLGTGVGLWLHGALRGEGTGRLASLLSFDSAVVRPAMVALAVVAASGAGLLWNTYRQEPASENSPLLSDASNSTLNAAPAGVVKGAPEAKIEEKSPSGGDSVRESELVAASPAEKEKPLQTVTVTGHVIDEEQNPVPGATVSVVVCGTEISPAKPVAGFGGGGAVGGTVMGGGFGGGGAVGGTVSGSVTNGEEGGIAGGSVGVAADFGISVPPVAVEDPYEDTLDDTWRDETRRFSAKSAIDGSFSIPNVSGGGMVIISADASGYCLQGTIEPTCGTPQIDVTLTLSPGFPVEGRLLGAEGQPVADALLQISALQWVRENPTTTWRSSGGWSGTPQCWAWRPTDSNGRFTLTSKDSGHATISVRSKTQGKATFQRIPVGPGVVADLRFPKQSTVHGRITRHDGAPASGLIVLLTGHTGMVLGHDEHGETYGASGPTCKATTDADGAYRIAGVDPNMRYTVGIFNYDMIPLATAIDLEPLGAGQSLTWNYTIPRPIVVKGVATEQASGRPAVGATILCKAASEASESRGHRGEPDAQATTGPEGGFDLNITTRSGDYVFGIQTLTGFRALSQREVRDGETIVLNLVLPGSWLRNFLVLDASGNPLSGVSVMVVTEGNDMRFGYPQKTGDDGRIRVTHLTSGDRVKCLFQYEGHEAESESVVGQEGMEFPEETIVIDLST